MGPRNDALNGVQIPHRKGTFEGDDVTRLHTSPYIHISQNSNRHISVLCDATVTWLGTLVVLHVLYMLI